MPTFDTPDSIDARITNAAGDITVTATDTATTTVEVSPVSERDREAAEQTLVDLHDGRLRVEVPQQRGWGRTPEIEIRVAVPAHSSVETETASADSSLRGEFGDVRVHTASGDVGVDVAHGAARIETASGDINLGIGHGSVSLSAASGDVRLGGSHGDAEIDTASGDIEIGTAHAAVKVSGASGDIRVGEVHGDVSANSASGDVDLGWVHGGRVSVSTASGSVRVGIPAGLPTWLDLHSLSGAIDTDQADDTGPSDGENSLELRVNTVSGDITVHRAR